mgnify:CR=1 FL=1
MRSPPNSTDNCSVSELSSTVFPDVDLRIFTLDDESYEYFNNIHHDVVRYETNVSDEFVGQKSEGFGNLMVVKFEIIYESLKNYDYVLYIDGDIVVKEKIMDYLISKLKYKDIVFQNDKRPSKPNLINMCAGFMFIKSSKKTLKFFNPENIDSLLFDDMPYLVLVTTPVLEVYRSNVEFPFTDTLDGIQDLSGLPTNVKVSQ